MKPNKNQQRNVNSRENSDCIKYYPMPLLGTHSISCLIQTKDKSDIPLILREVKNDIPLKLFVIAM